MSESNRLSAAPAGRRGIEARRTAALVLAAFSGKVLTLAWAVVMLAVAGGVTNRFTGIFPVYNGVTGWEMGLAVLAIWGGAHVLGACAYDLAGRVDPDARDGDVLWDVTEDIKHLASEVQRGSAHHDDVRIGLQVSAILPAVEQLLGALGDAYDKEGEDEEAGALYVAAVEVRDVARHLGTHGGHTA